MLWLRRTIWRLLTLRGMYWPSQTLNRCWILAMTLLWTGWAKGCHRANGGLEWWRSKRPWRLPRSMCSFFGFPYDPKWYGWFLWCETFSIRSWSPIPFCHLGHEVPRWCRPLKGIWRPLFCHRGRPRVRQYLELFWRWCQNQSAKLGPLRPCENKLIHFQLSQFTLKLKMSAFFFMRTRNWSISDLAQHELFLGNRNVGILVAPLWQVLGTFFFKSIDSKTHFARNDFCR